MTLGGGTPIRRDLRFHYELHRQWSAGRIPRSGLRTRGLTAHPAKVSVRMEDGTVARMQFSHGARDIDGQTRRGNGRYNAGRLQACRFGTDEIFPDSRVSALSPDQQLAGSVGAIFEKSRDNGSIGVDFLKTFRSLNSNMRVSDQYSGDWDSGGKHTPECQGRWKLAARTCAV